MTFKDLFFAVCGVFVGVVGAGVAFCAWLFVLYNIAGIDHDTSMVFSSIFGVFGFVFTVKYWKEFTSWKSAKDRAQ
ncbi:hypothetical protein [Photobacterium indicum]|uniref:hypothetical protein n=1 Tax=Photobacterium indicum TaxID=81447 RepID=UPI003D097FC4